MEATTPQKRSDVAGRLGCNHGRWAPKVGPEVVKVWICFVFWMTRSRPGGALAGGLREDWAPFLSDWSTEIDQYLNGPALDLADAFDRHAIAKLQGIGVAEAEALLARQLAVLEGMHRRHAEAAGPDH